MKRLVITFCLFPTLLLADVLPPAPATQAEVNAGVLTSKYVSPKTLAGFAGQTNVTSASQILVSGTTSNYSLIFPQHPAQGIANNFSTGGTNTFTIAQYPVSGDSRFSPQYAICSAVQMTNIAGWNPSVSPTFHSGDLDYCSNYLYVPIESTIASDASPLGANTNFILIWQLPNNITLSTPNIGAMPVYASISVSNYQNEVSSVAILPGYSNGVAMFVSDYANTAANGEIYRYMLTGMTNATFDSALTLSTALPKIQGIAASGGLLYAVCDTLDAVYAINPTNGEVVATNTISASSEYEGMDVYRGYLLVNFGGVNPLGIRGYNWLGQHPTVDTNQVVSGVLNGRFGSLTTGPILYDQLPVPLSMTADGQLSGAKSISAGTFSGDGSGLTNLVSSPAAGQTNLVGQSANGSLFSVPLVNLPSGGGAGGVDTNVNLATNWLGSINIVSYGAVGDGLTDDTAALRAALQDGQKSNLLVFIPPGVFLSDCLTSGASMMGVGPNSVLLRNVGATGTMIDTYTNKNLFLQNFCLNGNTNTSFIAAATNGAQNGLRLYAYGTAVARGIVAVNFSGYGILLDGTNDINNRLNHSLVTGCFVTNCFEGIVGAQNNQAEYCKVSDSFTLRCQKGLVIRSANMIWSECDASDCGYGLYVSPDNGRSHSLVSNCQVNHSTIFFNNCASGINVSGGNWLGSDGVMNYAGGTSSGIWVHGVRMEGISISDYAGGMIIENCSCSTDPLPFAAGAGGSVCKNNTLWTGKPIDCGFAPVTTPLYNWVGQTNAIFLWTSNGVPPSVWTSYFTADKTLLNISHNP